MTHQTCAAVMLCCSAMHESSTHRPAMQKGNEASKHDLPDLVVARSSAASTASASYCEVPVVIRKLLSRRSSTAACVAEQHFAVGNTSCPLQCCSALTFRLCKPVSSSNLHRCNWSDTVTAVSLFCRAALNSGKCILPDSVLQCIVAGSLQACIKLKPPQV